MAASEHIVWIDCEMTGLNPSVDELVEVAVVVTDFELNVLDPGCTVVIRASDAAMEQMNDFVTEMHRTSGLAEEIPNGVTAAEAEQQVLEYIRRFVKVERTAPLGGNTIGTDRAFLARYMPELDGYLHYRNIDVSSIKELSRRWYPRAYFQSPKKHGGHRALADILESIGELRYYRQAVFTQAPGHDTEALKGIAAEVVEGFSEHLDRQ